MLPQDVFFQTETFTIDAAARDYRVKFNNNYKRCIGVMCDFPGTTLIAGFKQNGVYDLNPIPTAFLNSYAKTIEKKRRPLNMKASKQSCDIFVGEALSFVGTEFRVVFLLTNDLGFSERKFFYDFEKITISAVGTTRRALNINNTAQRIKGLAFYNTLYPMFKISIRTEDRYFLSSFDSDFYPSYNSDNSFDDLFIAQEIDTTTLSHETEQLYNGGLPYYIFMLYKFTNKPSV